MEQRIGFLARIKEAVSNFSFANTIIRERAKKALKYFLLLVLFISVFNSIYAFTVTKRTFVNLSSEIEAETPNFEIKDGILFVDSEQPIILDDHSLIVIDTTGSTTLAQLKAQTTNKNIILVDSKKIYYYSPSEQYKNQSLELANFQTDLSKQQIIDYLSSSSMIPTLFAVMAIFVTFIGKMIGTLVAWIIASIAASAKKVPVTSAQTYSLALYALTAPSLIKLITNVFPNIPFFTLIYYGILVFYLIRYLDEIKNNTAPLEVNDNSFVIE